MISDMLFLAKAENGLAIVHREPVDLAREVQDLFDFYEALADEQAIRLDVQGAGVVLGDRLMLRRALNNLLSNALRHTPAGGQVTVTIVRQAGQIVLTVENTGEMIPAQHLARLFERFYRADPSRQHASGEGTGLGLAITQAILRAHRGNVSVASARGLTTFTLRLPF
jgi:two-component system heavy metal sensor histidine kinase CusS